jgi:hypothetical protein
MSFCDHCEGQRFDRARVLRALRRLRRDLQATDRGREPGDDDAIEMALQAVKALDIPHLEILDDDIDDVVH